MLKNIIKEKHCASCKQCCQFEIQDLWDTPIFSQEEKEVALKYAPDISFVPCGDLWKIRLNRHLNKYICPLLDETGCRLSDKKPFDCKLWPIYVMDFNGSYVIAQSPDCAAINGEATDTLLRTIHTLSNTIEEQVSKYRGYVKPFMPGYRVWYMFKENR